MFKIPKLSKMREIIESMERKQLEEFAYYFCWREWDTRNVNIVAYLISLTIVTYLIVSEVLSTIRNNVEPINHVCTYCIY